MNSDEQGPTSEDNPTSKMHLLPPKEPELISHPIPKKSDIPLGQSPSYTVLESAGLLITKYSKSSIDDLDMLRANTDKNRLFAQHIGYCMLPICGPIIQRNKYLELDVPPQHIQRLVDHEGACAIAGPGLHLISGGFPLFWKPVEAPVKLEGHIQHGDMTIVVIKQGYVGLAWDKGDPILLPPGLHQWVSDTRVFETQIDLSKSVIHMGPYTLVTVDDGYAAVSSNNGKQAILAGGHVHFLTHQNWTFNHVISLKVQTDNLERIEATSADNIIMSVTSTVNWRIVDVQTAALMAAETMKVDAGSSRADISKLRKDVLKQAMASLASFIGSVNYSDSFHLAAAAQASAATTVGFPAAGPSAYKGEKGDNPLFNRKHMKSAVQHANEVTRNYGVEVISINVISADPVDKKLTTALASGAVASAEALQAETAARGKSRASKIDAETDAENTKIRAEAAGKAMRIEAESEAEAAKIKAEGEAEANIIKAKAAAEAARMKAAAARDAANLLSSSDVAVDLAKMELTGEIIGNKVKFFFGSHPDYMSKLVMKGYVGQQ